MSYLGLNIRELIRFYDDDPDARLHSNAVKTLAGEEVGLSLCEHFLNATQRAPARIDNPCTSKGAWLDGWIKVASPESTLYQIEVKSWSMHGYGSRRQRLGVDASPDEVAQYKMASWRRYWDGSSFRDKGLKKVLRRMNLPPGEAGPAEAVACLWTAVHPQGLDEPMFTEPSKGTDFAEVTVFSASAYLRQLMADGTSTIRLALPKTKQRLAYLAAIFDQRNGASCGSQLISRHDP